MASTRPRRSTRAPARARSPEPADGSNGSSNGAAPDPAPALRALAAAAPAAELLQRAVEEAARLLDADGAMIYLLDEQSGFLNYAFDAGIAPLRERRWIRRLQLPLGAGMFGVAAAERRVTLTQDYPADTTFRHSDAADRFVAEVGLRSMVVAPLVAGDRVFGSMGTFAKRPNAFGEQAVALVRSLADHAAAAMANAILIEELASSRAELERRAEAEKALREIATRISAIHGPADVIQRAVDEAARLLGAEGARIDLIDPANGLLRWAYQSGADRPSDEVWPEDPDERLEQGVSGKAVVERQVFVTGDYLADDRFIHRPGPDSYIRSEGIKSVMAAPLVGDRGAFGALTVYTRRPDAWDTGDAEFIDALATEAAIAIQNARLIEELGRSREEVAERAEAEQALREIAARITAIREPSELLQHVIEEAKRLVRADGGIIDLLDHIEDGRPVLRWSYDTGLRDLFDTEELQQLWIPVGSGATGVAVAEDRVFLANHDPRDQFPASAVNDAFFDRTGFQSMIIAPISSEGRPLGAIEVYSRRAGAFTEADAGLIRSLADQAAIAIQNARLIEELARSRAELERAADAERTLREIAARITAIRDPDEILQQVIDAATRLLRASGAMINLVGAIGTDPSWAHVQDERISNFQILDSVSLEPRAGVSGLAIATGQVALSGDYLNDDRFNHTDERDEFVRSSGITSVIAAPVLVGDQATGAITVYSPERNAFSEADAALLKALADQAAVTITNAQLIDQLERAREEVQRRADAEHSLRQISANISSIRDSSDVLQQTINEATRLLRADGGIIDLLDPEANVLRWAFDTGMFQGVDRDRFSGSDVELGKGIAGRAVVERRVIRTGDYLDHEFTHTEAGDDFATELGIRSVIAAPILGEAGPVGAIEIYARRPQAFDDLDAAVLGGLADQAAIAIQNARLIEALDRSREENRRRADAEQALREIAANISSIRDADVILQQTVDEARRLLRSSDVRIDLVEGERQVWAYTSARHEVEVRRSLDRVSGIGDGVSGKAISERRMVRVADYLTDDSFSHTEASDRFVRESGLRSVLAVPLIAEGEPIGAISAASNRPDAYDDADAELLQALAHQATIAIQNARLIAALEESKETLATRADAERSLREMAGRIAELRDPDELIRQIVDDALRLLRSDGAHLTRMSDEGTHVVPVVIAGELDPSTETWLMGMRFPLMGGINGLAAGLGQPVWTVDYTTDERIPRERDDLETAARLGLRGMAAVPLRSDEGRVIGTLAVSFREPHTFDTDELAILKALADHASIAITNSSLYERLRESEGRYRHLVQNSPDLVWSIDAEARFSFLSDTCERLTGWRPDELLGKHFGALVHDQSRDVAELDWTAGMTGPSQELRGRLFLLHKDGRPIPAEFTAMGGLDEDGRFAGATGSVRDTTERDRLERELRDSEERYRFLVENSPDIVFSTDVEGRLTYVSETIERSLGYRTADVIGRPFAEISLGEPGTERGLRWSEMARDPSSEMVFRYTMVHRDGREIPFEVSARGLVRDGAFAGVYGAARDVSDRERLERELRDSEERYRFLVENSPDIIFSTDANGLYTYYSETVERLTGWRPDEMVGQHFANLIDMATFGDAEKAWQAFVDNPQRLQIHRFDLRTKDGGRMPVEVSAIGMLDADGTFAGIHGAARDVSERERLERQLRQSEERYRFLVQNSPDVIFATDAEGGFTYLSETIERLVGRKAEEVLGKHFSVIVGEGSLAEASSRWQLLSEDPAVPQIARLDLVAADGRMVPVEVSAIGMTDGAGRFRGITGSARDIRERLGLERDLREQAAALAAGEERSHLARELHDSVTQALFSMTLLTRTTEMLLDRDQEAARRQLGSLRELQREALAEMRALIFELRPGNLEQDGLIHALKTHSAALQGRIGLPIVVKSELEGRLPIQLEEVIYRIAQEGLHNVVKHAGARNVRLELGHSDGAVRLRIVDDGRGFDPAAVPDGHLGLAGMRARAEKIGATFDVRSRPGSGTTIEVSVTDEAVAAIGAAPAAEQGSPTIRSAE